MNSGPFSAAMRRKLAWLIAVILGLVSSASADDVYHAQGELAGEITATTVLLQTRLTAIPGPATDENDDVPGAVGVVRFLWSDEQDFLDPESTDWFQAVAERDYIVRTKLEGLSPGTTYYYRVEFGPDTVSYNSGPIRRFKTLAGEMSTNQVRFCMGSCMHYTAFMTGKSNGGGPVTATAIDKTLGYPSVAAMKSLTPDFFIGTGDIVYYDHPNSDPSKTVDEMRRKWHQQFRFPRLVEFLGQTPAFWSKDDHDFRFNDADLLGTRLPAAATGISLFREQLPLLEIDDKISPTYRTHRINRDLQIWFVEGRDYRSPNSMPDGPEKTIWGEEQKRWLRQTMQKSGAKWKVIVTPTPMVGPDRASKADNHTNPKGFRFEAAEFFAWLESNGIENVLTFCGDRHWQYHSIHPSGVQEFCCGALNDENSIRGIGPGAKGSTDPEAKIIQPYRYEEPTGGFLFVTVEREGAKSFMKLHFCDDLGKVLHEIVLD